MTHEEAEQHFHVFKLRLVDEVLHVKVNNLDAVGQARLVDGATRKIYGALVDLYPHSPKFRIGASQAHEALCAAASQVRRYFERLGIHDLGKVGVHESAAVVPTRHGDVPAIAADAVGGAVVLLDDGSQVVQQVPVASDQPQKIAFVVVGVVELCSRRGGLQIVGDGDDVKAVQDAQNRGDRPDTQVVGGREAGDVQRTLGLDLLQEAELKTGRNR